MKDFYDLLVLSRLLAFDGALLARAIAATFARRDTDFPDSAPYELIPAFASDPEKTGQWRAFTTRETLLLNAPYLAATDKEVAAFVLPPLELAAGRLRGLGRWNLDAAWET